MKSGELQGPEGGFVAWTVGVFCILFLGAIQVSPLAQWGAARVDLLLGLTMAWAALAGPRQGMLFGALCGAALDLWIGGGVLFLAVHSVLGGLSGLVRPVLNVRKAVIVMPLVFLATAFKEGCLAQLLHGWQHFGRIWLWAGVANSLAAWPSYLLLRTFWRPGRGPTPATMR